MMWHRIGQCRNKMHHVKKSQAASRHVGRATLSKGGRHPGHLHGPNHSSEIIIIRLHDLHCVIGNEAAKAVQAVFLFAQGDGQGKGLGNLPGLFVPVEHYRLFEKTITIFLQQLPNADRFFDRIKSVGIGE